MNADPRHSDTDAKPASVSARSSCTVSDWNASGKLLVVANALHVSSDEDQEDVVQRPGRRLKRVWVDVCLC